MGADLALSSWFGRVALVGALAAGLALAGCGRKGPLEPPPSANAVAAAPPQTQPSLGEPEHPGLGRETRTTTQGAEATVPVQKRPFFLDWLLK